MVVSSKARCAALAASCLLGLCSRRTVPLPGGQRQPPHVPKSGPRPPHRPQDGEKDAAAAAKEAVMETIDHARARGLVSAGEQIVTMYNVERQCAVIRIVECPSTPIDPVVVQHYQHQVMKRPEVCVD